jgi:hypothetical protein
MPVKWPSNKPDRKEAKLRYCFNLEYKPEPKKKRK